MAAATAAAAISFCSVAVNADVLSYTYNAASQDFSAPGFLRLDNAGNTKISFTTTQPNQRVAIFLNAQCLLPANTDFQGGKFATIQILVDPAGPAGEFIVPPTNFTDGDLCVVANPTTDSTASVPQLAMVGVSVRPAQAGTSTVRVKIVPGSNPPGATVVVGVVNVGLTIMR